MFQLTWNRVIAAVRIPWKSSLVWAIFRPTSKMPKAVIITRTVSFFYSTLASGLRWTTFPCVCISVHCPIASNWNFYKKHLFEILWICHTSSTLFFFLNNFCDNNSIYEAKHCYFKQFEILKNNSCHKYTASRGYENLDQLCPVVILMFLELERHKHFDFWSQTNPYY